MKRNPQQGVALVVTLILLSVITFLAIAFLVLSQRERSSVAGMTDQIVARFAAEAAVERATVDMLAPILAYTNPFIIDLRVSTNYINPYGFVPANGGFFTNTSYAYANGQPIAADDYLQNLTNLFYDPRPPVFIVTNRATGSNEFRYYLDLNRNGRYDTNGFWPVISTNLNLPFYDINGNEVGTNYSGPLSNFFVGDPEWIGVLERPEFPHSATNRFTSRYAYLVAPAGKTLDLNYMFNQGARKLMDVGADIAHQGYLRNQGVGSWEINLPAFLRDLNTNSWFEYAYDPFGGVPPPTTPPFQDAFWFLNYRYGGSWAPAAPVYANYNSLSNVQTYFNGFADAAFRNDYIDGYTDGPLMFGTSALTNDDDIVTQSWPGADNANHFFTTQELFDPAKTSGASGTFFGFTNRLLEAGLETNSYDRYTFYRLLSQLGTDSGAEPPGRIHINYDNVTQAAAAFSNWNSLTFFTNVAHKLLVHYTTEWSLTNPVAFFETFGTNRPFGVTNIPVWVGNRPGSNFVYSAGVHRLLQLAANLRDATTDSNYPSLFRPILANQNNNVYIIGFTNDVETLAQLRSHPITNLPAAVGPNDLVFGVPLVIGAKKGFPNFNEFAMQSVFQITRKLQVTRKSIAEATSKYVTNMMYVIGISNVIGVEAWNSYRASYTNPVDIYVTNYLTMELTNDAGLRLPPPPVIPRVLSGFLQIGPASPYVTNRFWQGYGGANSLVDAMSFKVPLKTNVVFLPDMVYRYNPPRLTNNLNVPFEKAQGFPQPQWRLAVTNRLQFIMADPATGRLIDYVQLDGLNSIRDLSAEVADLPTAVGYEGLWSTNRQGGGTDVSSPPMGVVWQIDVSQGGQSLDANMWRQYGNFPEGTTPALEIARFKGFFTPNHIGTFTDPANGRMLSATNIDLVQQVPFTPTKRVSQYLTWQANDPLVHYTARDLVYVALGNGIQVEQLRANVQTVKNIGVLNDRYQPWGRSETVTDPNSYNLALKDPLVRSSDDWDFPTNKFPTIGWLGRVHRGTPWQTVYLKSTNVVAETTGLRTWADWTGNTNGFDAMNSTPVSDRQLFDLFTTAPNENATRGQLSINQAGLAAWSAVLSGVLVFTNQDTDTDLQMMALTNGQPQYSPFLVEPAGSDPNSPLRRLVDGINRERTNLAVYVIAGNRVTNYVHPDATFWRLGDILSVPELTVASPFLNLSSETQKQAGLSDAVYERIPQQILSLLRASEPRFVIYAYGQSLKPADRSIVTAGPFFGLCANYQITAEVATRTVVRVEGSPDPRYTDDAQYPYPDPRGNWRIDPVRGFYPPRIVVESFNALPPD